MTMPFALPAWVPSWLPFVVLVGAVLYLLVFLIMPFSVFGVKSRLDSLEAELDEIHAEIRRLALRLPEPIGADPYDDPSVSLSPPEQAPEFTRPPIPPAPEMPAAPMDRGSPRRLTPRSHPPRVATSQRSRAEPRLDWPH